MQALSSDLYSIHTILKLNQDIWVWNSTEDGIFSAKLAWESIRKKHEIKGWNDSIWSRSNNPKMAFTTYKAINLKLPATDKLTKLGLNIDLGCKFCGKGPENRKQLFFNCEYNSYILNIFKLKFASQQTLKT